MKKPIFIVICMLLINAGQSQNPYYDAKKLAGYVEAGKFIIPGSTLDSVAQKVKMKEYCDIINKYYDNKFKTSKEIHQGVGTYGQVDYNPFIGPFLSPGSVKSNSSPVSLGAMASSAFSSIGGIDVTNFADGLAKFLVERSKEELNVAFFRNFQNLLTRYPEVKIIFPNTSEFLGIINAYQYAAMIPALRAAFQKDLNSIGTNLLNLRNTSNYIGYGKKDPKINDSITNRANRIVKFLKTPEGRSVVAAVIVSNGIVKGNNAAEIVNNLASDDICTGYPDENFANTFRFINLISQSLRSNDDGRVWVTKQQINELINDDVALKMYFGLLYATEQHNTLPIKFRVGTTSITFNEILTALNSNWLLQPGLDFKKSFAAISNSMSDVADNFKIVVDSKKKGDQASILVYADYASSVSGFLKQAVAFISNNKNISPKLSGFISDVDKFIVVLDDATNTCYDIKSQNYGALVLHTSALLTELLPGEYKFKNDFIKYGTFMASIVEAKNSDEVKAAIDAAVLPVGSSSIKRETTSNISLNAFIGPFGGSEYMPVLKKNPWAFTAGVTAPVGVAFSFGNIGKPQPNTKCRGGKSFTIFIPVIDVGALASFRAGNDSTKVASVITLGNIIAPGLYFYWGFGKCPVSLGFGGQLGPQLREVTAKEVNIDKNYYVRIGLNLVVDIPLFNFYTKNNNIQ